MGDGNGNFQTAAAFDIGGHPLHSAGSCAVGDFNGDGKPDLVVANQGSYDENSGTFTNSGVTVLLNTCASVQVALAIARADAKILLF